MGISVIHKGLRWKEELFYVTFDDLKQAWDGFSKMDHYWSVFCMGKIVAFFIKYLIIILGILSSFKMIFDYNI